MNAFNNYLNKLYITCALLNCWRNSWHYYPCWQVIWKYLSWIELSLVQSSLVIIVIDKGNWVHDRSWANIKMHLSLIFKHNFWYKYCPYKTDFRWQKFRNILGNKNIVDHFTYWANLFEEQERDVICMISRRQTPFSLPRCTCHFAELKTSKDDEKSSRKFLKVPKVLLILTH